MYLLIFMEVSSLVAYLMRKTKYITIPNISAFLFLLDGVLVVYYSNMAGLYISERSKGFKSFDFFL